MPTHALLGATGATGSAVLRYYLDSPPANLTLNIFIRSLPKLLQAFPNLESTTSMKINITEAPLTDNKALQTTLGNASVVHMCIATNSPKPGNRVAQDAAESIVSALESLKIEQRPQYTKPTILVLRTSLCNPAFTSHVPTPVYHWLWFVLHHIYADLASASKVYEESSSALLEYVFVDPPALFDSVGAERTGHRLFVGEEAGGGGVSAGVNYADLGAAFGELAERRGEFVGRGVGVSATGFVREEWSTLVWYQLEGLRGRIFG